MLLCDVLCSDLMGEDFSKLSNPGQFISVDGRPLSTARGTPKEVVRLYKSYIKSCARQRGLNISLTDPILCLHILCPVGAYDVNIEPAKDDVLFADANTVTALAESLFKKVYGDLKNSDEHPDGGVTSNESNPEVREPKTPPPTNPGSAIERSRPIEADESQIRIATPPPSLPERAARESEGSSDRLSTNPWTITRTRVFSRTENQRSTPATRQGIGSITYVGNRARATFQLESESRTSSPEGVSQTPIERDRDSGLTLASPITSRNRERSGGNTLDAWLHPNEQDRGSSASFPNGREDSVLSDGAESGMLLDETDDDDAMQPADFTMPSSLSKNSEELFQQHGSPGMSNTPESALAQEKGSGHAYQARDKTSYTSEVETALDFERRKRAGLLLRRQQMRKMKDPAAPNTPHRNRFLAARAALAEDAGVSETQITLRTETSLKPSDPRALFMRDPNAATSRLPLERIPQGFATHDIGLAWPASLDRISVLHKLMTESGASADPDPAPKSAFTSVNLEPACKEWEDTLNRLLRERYKAESGIVKDIYTAVSKAISSSPCDI